MSLESVFEEIEKRYKLICRKCNSENVVVSEISDPINYGGETGYQSGTVAIGCNDCKQNDMWDTV